MLSELALTAHTLTAWTQGLLLDGEHQACEPKRLRYRLLHVAAKLTRHARRSTLHLPVGLDVRDRRRAGDVVPASVELRRWRSSCLVRSRWDRGECEQDHRDEENRHEDRRARAGR